MNALITEIIEIKFKISIEGISYKNMKYKAQVNKRKKNEKTINIIFTNDEKY